MSHWRNGPFDRTRVSGIFRSFTPAHAEPCLENVDLQGLFESGKRLLLLDIDHTLVQWRTENFTGPVLQWIDKAKTLGFEICIISNTNKLERLQRIKERLGVETVRGRFKPSRAMYRLALIRFKRKPSEAVMIGDQLFTDILGANRAGIDAIWVQKMDGPELITTRLINRVIERFFTSFIYEAMVTPVRQDAKVLSESPTSGSPGSLAVPASAAEPPQPERRRALLHQFIRFAIVGVTSFAIDFTVRMLLMFRVPYGGGLLSETAGHSLRNALPWAFAFSSSDREAFVPIAATAAALIAIANSFVWNRLWTFEIRGKAERSRQFRRFLAISIVGLGLNVVLTTLFNHALPLEETWKLRIATVLAAAIVAVWNFTGSRLYAFRQPGRPT